MTNEQYVETFSQTATAAKLSGTYNETAGFIKRNIGRLLDGPELENAGKEQQLLGKVHRLVGSVRGVREAFLKKLNRTRLEGRALCREHGGKLLDGASTFVDELKRLLLK